MIFENFYKHFLKRNKLFWKWIYKIINDNSKQFDASFKRVLWRIEIGKLKERNLFTLYICLKYDYMHFLKWRGWYCLSKVYAGYFKYIANTSPVKVFKVGNSANAGAVNKHPMQQALLLASQLRLGVESSCMCEADRYVLLKKINPLEHRVLAGGKRMLFRLCWFESNHIHYKHT
jgi:hypothetical protein